MQSELFGKQLLQVLVALQSDSELPNCISHIPRYVTCESDCAFVFWFCCPSASLAHLPASLFGGVTLRKMFMNVNETAQHVSQATSTTANAMPHVAKPIPTDSHADSLWVCVADAVTGADQTGLPTSMHLGVVVRRNASPSCLLTLSIAVMIADGVYAAACFVATLLLFADMCARKLMCTTLDLRKTTTEETEHPAAQPSNLVQILNENPTVVSVSVFRFPR